MVSLVLFAIFVIVLFYLALIYTSSALALLAYMAASFVLFAFIWLIYLRCTICCKVTVPIAVADTGQPVTVIVKVRNRGLFTCSRMRICLTAGNSFSYHVKRQWIKASEVLPEESEIELTLLLPEAGNYEISLKRIRMYDLTGLFSIGFSGKSRADVQILPEPQAIGVSLTEPVRNFFGDSDVYDEKKAGPDNSELFQIRPFAQGDKLQSIHWKLSAKMDDLMVKENSLPKACPVVLFLDYHKRKKKNDNIGNFLKIASSLSFSLMDAGCPHYVAWYEEQTKDITRIRVDDEESFYLFLNYYLQEQGDFAYGELTELYHDKYRAEHYMYGIRLTEQLVLYKNGESFARMDRQKLDEELGGLELVL